MRAARAAGSSVSSASSAAAIASASSGSNVSAASPAISPSEPFSEQAHGTPRAIASASESPKPSNRLGNT